jgi:hypothetical protein
VVTNDEVAELLADCPTLFHMAEAGSWNSICERGLLSTTALLDLYQVTGDKRFQIESLRRANPVVVQRDGLPPATIRDQIPMDDRGLRRALPERLSPADWYRILNSKVFFWLTRARLEKLLSAKSYRDDVHDVIQVNTDELVRAYRERIWLCPINSGCTKPMPHPRDESTFRRISDYPYSEWRNKRARGERVVELAIDYGVPDVKRFVSRVTRMQREHELDVIYTAQ